MTNEVENVPELRFPEFEYEWVQKKIDNLTTKIGSGKTPKGGSANYLSEGIPFFRSQNIQNGYLNLNDLVYIDSEIDESMKNSKSYFGDILLNITGASIGRSAINTLSKTHININQHVCIIRLKKEFSFNFLGQFLLSPQGQKKIFKAQSGGSREGLNFKEIGSIKVNIPKNFNEQEKIGVFFSKLDRQIELEEEKLELLEQQKRGYMQKIFSQELRFKDDSGNSYPEWESAPLFDIFSATKGKSLSKDKISDDGKYECILYGEIYTTYAEKIESIVSRTNYYEGILSQKNDLIFPNSTTTNAWDLATFSSLQKNNVLIGGDISILRTKRSDISSLFYAYYLTNYLKLRKDIAKYAQGITIVHLSFNNFCKIKVQIPSLEEQNSITDFIDRLNQQQKLITNKIKLLKERKKGFLQKMFI